MYGQMTAGSWIYIGTQGILQGTYETFAESARQHFGGTLKGRLCVTAGCGGMGGAQPLAVTMNGGVVIVVEVDGERIERRLRLKYVDRATDSLDEALGWAEQARARREPLSIALRGNAATTHPAFAERGARFDVVTDQTSAHDPLRYVPLGLSVEESAALRSADPAEHTRRAHASMARHVEAMVGFAAKGAHVFDYGNNLREGARLGGLARETAFSFPGFVPAYIRPMFCEGRGPFRWLSLRNRPEDIRRTEQLVRELFPRTRVVVVSASQRRQDILMALEAGVHGYVPKGLGADDLAKALQLILEGFVYVPASLPEVPSARSRAAARGAEARPAGEAERLATLTPRQRDVLQLIVAGKSNKEIARALNLGEGTVKVHLAALFRNLGVNNRAAAAAAGARLLSGRE